MLVRNITIEQLVEMLKENVSVADKCPMKDEDAFTRGMRAGEVGKLHDLIEFLTQEDNDGTEQSTDGY